MIEDVLGIQVRNSVWRDQQWWRGWVCPSSRVSPAAAEQQGWEATDGVQASTDGGSTEAVLHQDNGRRVQIGICTGVGVDSSGE